LGLQGAPDLCSIFLLAGLCQLRGSIPSDVKQFDSETQLLDGLALALSDLDPDVIVGFETQTCSLGYLLDRAESLNHGFSRRISRVLENSSRGGERSWGVRSMSDRDGIESAGAKYFQRKGADIKIPGRHVLNLWRIVRNEIKLDSYTLEGVALSVLNVSLPKHDEYQIERWLRSERRVARALQHLRDRASSCLGILDQLNVLSRTSELARVYGIDFMSVLTRGSQYRVESMLARVAHERGFVLLSAQRDQVFDQPAVECLPLVMEPSSSFYVDPVIVLDFQSLYPSMVIAHNLCFSTMLGNINRLSGWSDEQHVGVASDYKAPRLPILQSSAGGSVDDGIYIAPNGEMFITASVRHGVLPQMLGEVLETRIMVKNAMKALSTDRDDELFKLMNARQFGLKMIANVTYGYASASFSGRMPCSGLADAIVQCGRDALERIVSFVDGELRNRTGANVVYGDTDSLFVCAPGASRAEAFAIGREITAKAASMFPAPVVLQLEKVYHPCILVTKKRYVGYAYDSPVCNTPIFDAKGIETVRRDSCGAAQKTMERALRLLFESKDVSRVKRFVQRIMRRICSNRMPLADFIFRKEVRLGTYKDVLPPAAVVASRAMESDPRASPRHGERVAFVVVYGGQGAALKDCVVSPRDFLDAELKGSMRIHSTYYITKQILPALDRLFSLLGAKVSSWFAELPRAYFEPLGVANGSRIHSYFPASSPCLLCRGRCVRSRICPQCMTGLAGRQASYYIVASRDAALASKLAHLEITCMRCIGGQEQDPREIGCYNTDCDVLYDRHRTNVRMFSLGDAAHDETTWKSQ
jgi:DNA polymerase zeta